jgi:hypothetical protein
MSTCDTTGNNVSVVANYTCNSGWFEAPAPTYCEGTFKTYYCPHVLGKNGMETSEHTYFWGSGIDDGHA